MKRKILLIFLTVIAVLFCSFGLSACLFDFSAPVESDGTLKYQLNKGTYRIVGFEGEPSEIIIPETFNERAVTAIGNCAFLDCASLKIISIPDSITSVGESVFSGCSNLEYNIHENVRYLGNEHNPYLCLIENTDSDISNCTVKANTKIIADCAFKDCIGLTSINLQDSVTTIGKNAFKGCSGLKSVILSESLTNIGYAAFEYCGELANITVPQSVISIGEWAFRYCGGLESISVAEGNNKYHSSGNCLIKTNSKTIITGCKNSIIPDDGSVTSIGESAFFACEGLTSIKIPDSITVIGKNAFNRCSGLTNFATGNGVKTIDYGAFEYCSKLANVTLGDSVKLIGSVAFSSCHSLTSITIPDSVTSIGARAFDYCDGLTRVTIGNGVTYISNGMFWGCSGLTSIAIPDSVTEIGVGSFEYCSGLKSITIPCSVTSIDNEAFHYCGGLTDINFIGTKKQWNTINSKSYKWNYNTGDYTVHCTDGDISKY